jgi:uncharacterized damage-inducible protein DinB
VTAETGRDKLARITSSLSIMTIPSTHANASPAFQPSTVTHLAFPDLERELAATRRSIARFPSEKKDFRPHEKSRTLGRLAEHIVGLPGLGTAMLTTDELDMATIPPATTHFETAAALLAEFDKNVAQLRPLVAAASNDALAAPWTLRHGNHILFKQSRSELFRHMMINHLVHHRAQLGVYYRLVGVPVPATYGPSADEEL